ncbi:FAD binding domain protein [Aspergillus fischeri NRRL 181]|uniref:FAD binding domain protein n=1 Tax=Neosartorya fischeri (strain ATCC 1020 / DSM 3700 / CBS 544.65 / FGSC A1164 / JCM 1740 / NRRL 181 / WB 181) TaxID=331117 RepID=A1DKC6_NEOFI|nr:FAD binding domain protein [Aspergillus fischeri NRRL 181]EAW17165.1 FAD binding domain protein [Aspergillus fischeri NRRL 181]KAG2003995.1 hypothetical protein GB937_009232 [Aspergillus fischeri]
MASQIPPYLIEELESLFTGIDQVISPQSPGYEEYLQRWSDLATQRAGVIIFPESAQDVSKAVRFSRRHNIDLVVKGGGHTPDGGNSSDGGITLDLKRMKKVSLHFESNTVTVQGGALWADVHHTTAGSGLVVASSTVSTTGVGGVTLQGGYGYLMCAHGLIIDNLLSAQVIIADGQLLTASESENSDLFWAIRGAGQNFGVVVEFTFQAHKQPGDVFAGSLVFTAENMATILESLNAALKYKDGKSTAQCIISQSPNTKELLVTVGIFYNGPENECRERFTDLFNLETVSADVNMMPYEEANTLFDSVSPPGGRKRIIAFDFASPIRPEFCQKIYDEVKLKFEAEPDLTRSYVDLEFWEMSKVCQVPTPATAFPSRMMTQKGVLTLQYTNPDKDEEYLQWAVDIQMMFQDEFKRAGYRPNMFVSNFTYYTKPSSTRSASDMFGVNGPRLVELKKKYDPQGFFNKLNPIST